MPEATRDDDDEAVPAVQQWVTISPDHEWIWERSMETVHDIARRTY